MFYVLRDNSYKHCIIATITKLCKTDTKLLSIDVAWTKEKSYKQ